MVKSILAGVVPEQPPDNAMHRPMMNEVYFFHEYLQMILGVLLLNCVADTIRSLGASNRLYEDPILKRKGCRKVKAIVNPQKNAPVGITRSETISFLSRSYLKSHRDSFEFLSGTNALISSVIVGRPSICGESARVNTPIKVAISGCNV